MKIKKSSALILSLLFLAVFLVMSGCDLLFPKATLTIEEISGEGTVLPEVGEHIFNQDAIVELEVIPEENWKFSHWGGADGDNVVFLTGNMWQITMKHDQVIKPYFALDYQVTAVEIVGPLVVEIPTPAVGEKVVEYEGTVLDQFGQEMPAEELIWSLETPAEGIAFVDGVLTVLDNADEIIVTIKAASLTTPEVYDELDVAIQKAESQATEIIITGPATVEIPGEGVEETYQYQATVFDQYGEEMDVEIEWDVDHAPYMMPLPRVPFAIDDQGLVTVRDTAKNFDEFEVIAAYGELEAVKVVDLYFGEQEATEIIITGPAAVEIPEEGVEETYQYQATVLDQYGEEMIVEIEWDVEHAPYMMPLPRVPFAIDDQGLVTVRDTAKNFDEFEVIAAYGELEAVKVVDLYFGEQEATEIIITGPAAVEIPEEGVEETYQYQATVLDQYGEEMIVEIEWDVEHAPYMMPLPRVPFEIDDQGLVTVRDTAKNFDEFEVIAAYEELEAIKVVDLF